jgi:hypothetical protein
MQTAEFEAFAQALSNPRAAIPASMFVTSGIPTADRFAVYRNNVHASLIDALCENFPISLALVGEEFFRALAGAYIQVHKPPHAVLHEYGGELPQFIANFRPTQTFPWLPDVARLEIFWRESWAAADATALALTELSTRTATTLAQSRVVAHPATRLLISSWPVASIWQEHQAGNPDLSGLEWSGQCVLITRPEATIDLVQLPPDIAHFANALLKQDRIVAEAAAATLDQFPTMDMGSALGALIRAGAILEINQS